MTETEIGGYLGEQQRGTDDLRGQFIVGSIRSDFRIFSESAGAQFTAGRKIRNVSGDTLIWDHTVYGIWDTQKWAGSVIWHDMDSTTNWTHNQSGSFVLATGKQNNAIFGEFTTGGNLFKMTAQNMTATVGEFGAGSTFRGNLSFWFYAASSAQLTTNKLVQVEFGNQNITNQVLWSGAGLFPTLNDGWNYIRLPSASGTHAGTPDFSGSVSWFQIYFDVNATTINGIDLISVEQLRPSGDWFFFESSGT